MIRSGTQRRHRKSSNSACVMWILLVCMCLIQLCMCLIQLYSMMFEDALVLKLRHLQGKIETNGTRSTPKILIYIATHMSTVHKAHFKHCWPKALQNSYLLNSSDIKIFLTPKLEDVDESMDLLNETFKNKGQNVSYHVDINEGYQKGARAAMITASKSGWFDSYDWIVRMNPDVIIQNDTWILDTMQNDKNASLLYVDCARTPDGPYTVHRNTVELIHTDFFALKWNAIPKGLLETTHDVGPNFERGFTKKMRPIVKRKEHRHIPGAYPKVDHFCRVNGNAYGPIFHFHTTKKALPRIDNWTCPAKFFQ